MYTFDQRKFKVIKMYAVQSFHPAKRTVQRNN